MSLPLLSRREKLLLGLLGSAMLFSFSFSYGAVNQAKVDSIMQTINTAANNFSSQSDRDTYYQRVYTGLSDAIDMLAVVRNNVGAMIGTAPVTVPPVTSPLPPTGGPNPLPVTVTNPIADYPIPPPCPAGVKIMKELPLGNGAPRVTIFPRTKTPVGVIYKIPTAYMLPKGIRVTINGNSFGGYQYVRAIGKISPYPCDFPDAPLKEFDNRLNEINGCTVTGGYQYLYLSTKEFSWKFRDGNFFCDLKHGQTYYLNIQPPLKFPGGNPTYCDDSLCGILTEMQSDYDPLYKSIQEEFWYWGTYSSFPEFVENRVKGNYTSEDPEALRQKVVNDYATKGVNTDVVPLRRADGTIVTPLTGALSTGMPPVGTGGGPVIVREGPWERVEDIFCPATLTGATDGLQTLYPNGYNYTNQGNTYWNVKNFQTPSDISLPATCTTGKKFVKHGMQGTCYVYECKN